MRRIVICIVCLAFLLGIPVTAGAKTEDISQMIREAQAKAIMNLGGITATDADAIQAECNRILREEYGIDIESVSVDNSENKAPSEPASPYDAGYQDGYSDGFKAGMLEAERRFDAEKEEMRNNRIGAYFSILIVVAISFFVSVLDKRKKRRK